MKLITSEHVMLSALLPWLSAHICKYQYDQYKNILHACKLYSRSLSESKHLDFTTFKCLSIKNGHDHEAPCSYLPMLQMMFKVMIAATHHAAIQITPTEISLSVIQRALQSQFWRMIHRIFWIKCINAWEEDTYHTQKSTFDVLETRNLAAYASSPPSSHLKSWTDNQITFYALQPGFNILLDTFFLCPSSQTS